MNDPEKFFQRMRGRITDLEHSVMRRDWYEAEGVYEELQADMGELEDAYYPHLTGE